MQKLPYWKHTFRRNILFGITLGTVDIGTRFTTMRWFVEGCPRSYPSGAAEYWRMVIPVMIASTLTCWIRGPLEIASKAFYADKKFPVEIR